MSTFDTWHLAANEDEMKVTEFELQLWRVFYGFQRWQEECERNSNGSILSSNEIAILHIIRMKNRPKTLTDIERLLNRNDTHNIRYSINKLLKIGLIKKIQSAYSVKNYYYEITEEGRKDTDNYSRMRKFILIHMFKESGLDLDELSKNLVKIKALYDEADRSVAQNIVKSQSSTEDLSTGQILGRILLVEDHNTTAHLTQAILTDLHYLVDVAENGKEALHFSNHHKYDIIFMDIGLSDISGCEVTKKIRSSVGSLNNLTPIIGLTAHMSSADKRECIEAGMNAVSTKPLAKEKIKDVLSMFYFKQSDDKHASYEGGQRMSQKDFVLKGDVIDLDLGAKLVGGNKAFAKEAIIMLVNSFSEEVSLLEKACNTLDLEKALSILHKLRGGISYCGVPRLKEACIRFHEYLKNGETTLILDHYKFLVSEFNLLKDRLAKESIVV